MSSVFVRAQDGRTGRLGTLYNNLISFLISPTLAPIGIAYNPGRNYIIHGPFSTVSSILVVLLLLLVPEPFLSGAALPPLLSYSLSGEFDPPLFTALLSASS